MLRAGFLLKFRVYRGNVFGDRIDKKDEKGACGI